MTPILRKNGNGLITSAYHKITVNGKPVDAHRHIMEQHLGRKLETWEEVHHKNEDTHDNRIDNLEIKSKPDHFRHHQKTMRRKVWTVEARAEYSRKFSGELGSAAKLTNGQVREIRYRASVKGESYRELAQMFGVSRPTISRIVRGKHYKLACENFTEQAA